MKLEKRKIQAKSLLLALCMLVALFPAAAIPARAWVQTGTCGDHLVWELDSENGTLTISGTGPMSDFSVDSGNSDNPWSIYGSTIKTVVIENGVTSIGGYAFATCTALESVTIPWGVESIGATAFAWCTSLKSVTLPGSVTSIGNSAFKQDTLLESVYFTGTSEQWQSVTEKVTDFTFGNDVTATVVFPESSFAALQTKFDSASTSEYSPTTVTLDKNYLAGGQSLTVPSGRYVTLDLNGFTLNGAGIGSSVITVETGGNLTLTDESVGKTGTVTGGKAQLGGGGVSVKSDGTFVMNRGTITGNSASGDSNNMFGDGGGVSVAGGGSFTMNGGVISGNSANGDSDGVYGDGGGVYIISYATFTMNGGAISGYSASNFGGGVSVEGGAIFSMNGGVISGNSADRKGGGVFVDDFSPFYLSGGAAVTGNTVGTGESATANNVELYYNSDYESGATITVTGELTGCIGVTMNNPGEFAQGDGFLLAAEDVAHFVSDKRGYVVERNEQYNAELRPSVVKVGESEYVSLTAALENWTDGTTLTLLADVVTDTRLDIIGKKSVTLDLNGHSILMTGNGSVIIIDDNAKLTLMDSATTNLPVHRIAIGEDGRATAIQTVSEAGEDTDTEKYVTGGVITGGSSNGGVYVVTGGTFEMNGGTISGNTAAAGGGGVSVYKGSFTMSGGTISGNAAATGGGVAVSGNGTFKMSGSAAVTGNTAKGYGGGVYIDGTAELSGGAAITGNTATERGGGVYVYIGCTFTMGNGTISGNTVVSDNGGGMYVDGTVELSGGASVAGNYKGTDESASANNVYLPPRSTITVTDELTGSEGCIGVTTSEPGVFAQGGGESSYQLAPDDVKRFASDRGDFAARLTEDGKAKLIALYPLWVGGEQVTEESASGTGWSYDVNTRTLTLDNYTYEGAACIEFDLFDTTYYAAIGWFGGDELKVVLRGTNIITEDISGVVPENISGADPEAVVKTESCGIYTSVASLSFSGGGSLEVTGSGGNNSNCGVNCDSCMTVSEGTTLTAAGGDVTGGYGSYGVSCGGLTVSGESTLTATGGKAGFDSCGVLCAETLTVESGSKLTAAGGDATADINIRSCGVGCRNLAVTGSGSSLTVSAGSAKGSSYGIFNIEDVTVDAAATLTASGETKAIRRNIKNFADGVGSDDGSTWTAILRNTTGQQHSFKKLSFPKLTVTFDANGGADTMDAQAMPYNFAAVLTENTFTRTGYAFAGWNTKANGSGTSYDDKASLTLTKNTTLYAQWEKLEPSVKITGVSGGTVSFTVESAPEGAVLIAARYDGGRLTAVTKTEDFAAGTLTLGGSGTDFKLMLVDGNYAPLCPAAAWPQDN